MDKEFLQQIKQKLLEEKKRLENQLAKFTKPNPANPNDYEAIYPEIGSEEEENALEIAEFNKNLTLERTFEQELQDVNNALERIENGTYGFCKYCKEPIDKKRLLARPTSSSCAKCKKKFTRI
jgi:RNA polymerase-binding protein DksA